MESTEVPLSKELLHARPTPEPVEDWIYEIGTSFRPDMRVPVRIFADDVLIQQIQRDRSLRQLVNVSTLPGIVDAALGMPDMHEGYGFPVGGVAATRLPDGVISPGGIGFDINCGVRLLVSELEEDDIRPVLEKLIHEVSRSVPAGFGRSSRKLSLNRRQLDHLLNDGVPYLVEELHLGVSEDVHFLESGGAMPGAKSTQVSERAKQRGHDQLGTLGGGNHFVEIQLVDQVFDDDAAAQLGLFPGKITVLVHTGSRGLGHQVCTDYVKRMDAVMTRHGIHVPDRQLACAPFSSQAGQEYFAAMGAAANYGFANRQVIAHHMRRIFEEFLGESRGALRLIYDVAHNTAKVERYGDDELVVHRKGATRAFGPSSREIPPAYQGLGQPVFIPGSMGTASYVLLGTDEARDISLASCCHGAGRAMSRTQSKHEVRGADLRHELEDEGIAIECTSNVELAEEAPTAYKDVDRVVDVVHEAGMARKVARLRPIAVLKG
ncbi:RtcB family protein [Vulgatibacter incomptus]|uniref:tRNA-splicing ligase RtcB n=1 Tax=Vulgatibacter incomptus TaxID=1391653 RepID=A0A0K1PIY0_9BACT|nr:RtcB family protein [Vulgatibacter incomptus]AKU93064.1 RNA-2',3'-PO4:RNA-5'-OH ligase [Vulgatibacter incomptus]